VTLTFDLLTLKVVSESRVTWATAVPILVFAFLDLGPMYATDVRRQTQTDRSQTASSLYIPPIRGGDNKYRNTCLAHCFSLSPMIGDL